MRDALFVQPRLAAIYDVFDGERDDLDAYVAIADELGARRVLDVGCGTGSLAVRLAATGREVTGADPAEASLAVARGKDPGGRVTWVHAEAAAVPPVGADLAVMTGNVAQVFLTDAAWADALAAIGRALRPGGHLVFETRRPAAQGWLRWEPGAAYDVPGSGLVTARLEVTSVRLPLVSFRRTFQFEADGAVFVSESTLRFREQDEVTASLAGCGYEVLEVRDAPDRPGLEYVFIARH